MGGIIEVAKLVLNTDSIESKTNLRKIEGKINLRNFNHVARLMKWQLLDQDVKLRLKERASLFSTSEDAAKMIANLKSTATKLGWDE